jgi:hypothetical protein
LLHKAIENGSGGGAGELLENNRADQRLKTRRAGSYLHGSDLLDDPRKDRIRSA